MYTLNTQDTNFNDIELSSRAYTLLKNDNVITFQWELAHGSYFSH